MVGSRVHVPSSWSRCLLCAMHLIASDQTTSDARRIDTTTHAPHAAGSVRLAAMAHADPVMLRATGLGRQFGELWAIRGMDFEVLRGEVLGLLGPNGAGKTTTVRMLTALIEPTEGTRLGRRPRRHRACRGGPRPGRDPDRDARALRQAVGARPTSTSSAGSTGSMPATRAARIEHYLRLFSLWDRRDDVAGTFSKGMKQKLAIARALLHDPAVIFLDEPTAALDPEAAFVVREAIECAAPGRAGRSSSRPTTSTRRTGCATGSPSSAAACCGSIRRPACAARSAGARGRGPPRRTAPDAPTGAGDRGSGRTGRRHRSSSIDRPARRRARPTRRRSTPALVRTLVAAGADIVEVRERATTLEQVYFEVMGVRPDHGEAAVMRAGIVVTVLRREWSETIRNRLLMSTILIPPLAPDDRAARPGRGGRQPRAAARAGDPVLAQRPEWASFTAVRAGRGVRRPAVPGVLPADAGLHPAVDRDVLDHRREAGPDASNRSSPTPIRTVELLAGKALAALVPGVLAGWLTYVVFVAAGLGRLRTAPLRGRHRPELAGRRLRPGTGGRARLGRGRGRSSARA